MKTNIYKSYLIHKYIFKAANVHINYFNVWIFILSLTSEMFVDRVIFLVALEYVFARIWNVVGLFIWRPLEFPTRASRTRVKPHGENKS